MRRLAGGGAARFTSTRHNARVFVLQGATGLVLLREAVRRVSYYY